MLTRLKTHCQRVNWTGFAQPIYTPQYPAPNRITTLTWEPRTQFMALKLHSCAWAATANKISVCEEQGFHSPPPLPSLVSPFISRNAHIMGITRTINLGECGFGADVWCQNTRREGAFSLEFPQPHLDWDPSSASSSCSSSPAQPSPAS